MLIIVYLVSWLLIHSILLSDAAATIALNCSNATAMNATTTNSSANVSAIIVWEAGDYNISCSEMQHVVFVVGCSVSNHSAPTSLLTTIRLLQTPLQVIVSDSLSDVVPWSVVARSLTNCSIALTYLNHTSISAHGADSPSRLTHVFIWSSSHMLSLVILLASMFDVGNDDDGGASFVLMSGNNSGSINTVEINATQGSSIIYSAGASVLRLAPGCPIIHNLRVCLNKTNVTAAKPGASLALVSLDNSTGNVTNPPPLFHVMVLDGIVGVIDTGNSSLMVKRDMHLRMLAYPSFNGTISARHCSFSATSNVLFNFDSPRQLLLSIEASIVRGPFVLITNATDTVTGNVSSCGSGAHVCCITVHSSHIEMRGASFAVLREIQNSSLLPPPPLVPLHNIDISNSSFELSGGGGSVTSPALFMMDGPSHGLSFTIRMSECTVMLLHYAARVVTSNSGLLVPVMNSVFNVSKVSVHQDWVSPLPSGPGGMAPTAPPSPLFELTHLLLTNTTFLFTGCNVTVKMPSHVIAPIMPPPALLMLVGGPPVNVQIVLTNCVVAVLACPLSAQVRPVALNITTSNGMLINVTSTIFVNLLAAMENHSVTEKTTGLILTIDCDSTWCVPMDDDTPCGALTPQRFFNMTAVPDGVHIASNCSAVNTLVGVPQPPWLPSAIGCTQSPSLSIIKTISGSHSEITYSWTHSPSIESRPLSMTFSWSATSFLSLAKFRRDGPGSRTLSHTRGGALTSVLRSSRTQGVSHSDTSANVLTESSTSPSETHKPPAPPSAETQVVVPQALQVVSVALMAPLAAATLTTSVAGVVQRGTLAVRFSHCPAPPPTNDDDAGRRSFAPRGSVMTISESPTRLTFGVMEGSMYRGAVVGNLAILTSALLLIVPIVWVRSRFRISACATTLTFGSVMASLKLPGRWFTIYSVLLQPTMTAVTGCLFITNHDIMSDTILPVIAFAAMLVPAGAAMWTVRRGCNRLVTHVRVAVPHPQRPTNQRGALTVLRFIADRHGVWVPAPSLKRRSQVPQCPPTSSDTDGVSLLSSNTATSMERGGWFGLDKSISGAQLFASQFDTLIGRVRSGALSEGFFLFGFVWSVVSGVAGSLDPNDRPSCVAAQFLLLAVAAGSLISMLVIRPYSSLVDLVVNVVLESLSLLAAIIAAVNMTIGRPAATSGDDDTTTTAQGILYAQLGISTAMTICRLMHRSLASEERPVVVPSQQHNDGRRRQCQLMLLIILASKSKSGWSNEL
jgi:hypothetical protein